ncbi:MAG: hypothetical protein J1E34_03240 [Oscillospiraceae bacterium]|nr:hypothetical protein [Oscillospiraceae bacterium]
MWIDLGDKVSEEETSENSIERIYNYSYDENTYVVYRAVDAAGNDVYSSFDHTIPEISKVTVEYNDAKGNQSVQSGSIYTNGDITVKMTVKDKRLAVVKEGYTYSSAELKVYDKINNDELYSAPISNSQEKFSVFYDKWDVEFVIPVSKAELLDKPLFFVITAQDQVGNEAPDYSYSGEIVICTEEPEITVTYDYTDGAGAQSTDNDTVYSKSEITAHITVSAEYFGDNGKASVKVTDSDGQQYNVTFNKSAEEWTGDLVIGENGDVNDLTLTIEATSQAGVTNTYTSPKLYVDKTAPEISVTYSYNTRNNEVLLNANGEAEIINSESAVNPTDNIYNNGNEAAIQANITVSDDNLYPFGADSATSCVVKVNGTPCEVTWTKADGSWTAKINLPCDSETAEQISLDIEAADQAGNKKSYSFDGLYNDYAAPEISAVKLALEEESGFIKAVHTLLENTLGVHFSVQVNVTVEMSDDCSGENALALYYESLVNNSDSETVLKQIEQKTGSESGGKKCYYITLPEVTDEEPLAYWEKNIRFAVSDNVGNTSLFDLSDLDEKDLVDYGDTAILYETTAPEITISENDADNNSIFYTDNNLRWILNNKSILITVSDETAEGLDSGIYSIRVDNKVNGKENKDVYTFIGTDLNKKTLTSSIEFEYKELGAGKNEITVYVEDISGNTNSQSITVYKDETEPVVAKIDLSAEEGTYSVLNHGNYFSSDAVLTVDVLDAQYTSGIASVKAFYIAGEKRTELVQRETQSPASGSLESGNNETTRIFDIEYLNDTEGYIEIVITDNVGNEQTFTKDSAIPENSAVKVNSLIFEKTPAEISAGIVAGDNTVKYEQSETKVFYSNSDIVFNILIDDTVGENAKQVSGIASYEIALNGKTLEKLTADTSKEYSDKTANISYSFNAGEQGVAQEGLNTVTVKVTDNAGNENSEVYEFYIDTNEPVITSIGLSKKDLSAVEKVLRTLTFGNFFNDTVVLTVGVKDADAAEVVSGMKSVTLIMSDAEGNEQEKIENTDYTKLGDGSLSYTFELPDSDKELSAWTSILSISASDNVDNATEVQSISSFGDGVETNFTNSLVLYEKEPPKVETSINNGENGAANEDVLFVDNSNKTYWMRENQNFEIAVTDKLLGEGLNSGLYSVSITNKGVSVYDIVYVDENTTEALSDASYIIEYGKFEAGRNTVVVTAVDNAGNKTVEEYLVYKDETAPVVADIKLSGEAGKYNILTHGNYFSVDAVLTVDILDAQYTSGIASVEAFYVAGKKRTELVQRETQALASDSLENGYNETTRVFDIPYDENAEGYIEIIIKDNVGNESIFTADSQLPENFSIKVNSLMFERSQSAIGRTEKTSKPGYTASDSKEFYINDDIEYEIEINDTNDKISGISTVKITLNNTEVLYKDERNTKEGIKSYSFNVKDVIKAAGAGAALEGINVIKIESTDNAGNYNEKEFVFYIDTKAPVVQSIVMSLEKPDVAGKALNILPFGNFFNDTVILTVGIKDDDEITSAVSGMKSLTLHYVDNATENKEVKTAVNTDGKTEDGITYYSFKLPVPSKAEAEKALNYWLSDLSLSATDNVGNVMDTTAINEFGESVANFENSAVLFETSAPTIKSSYDTKDTNVLYMEKNSSWVRDGKSFVITVEDSSLAAGLNSGLNSVRVKRNSVSMSEYNYSVAGATEPVFTHTINFAYSDLVEGENIITVDFVDNAGNQASKTYVVYKDVDIPQITKIEFAGEKGSNLSYGNFYSENMTVTLNLLDTEYSSGIKSVTVNYITENGTVIALTEQKPSNPETNALTSGENSIVRVFDLAANNTTGYLEIVVTDNVGNSFTFGKDSEIPSGSNIKNTFLMMEKTVPVITETIAQSAYVCDENSEDKKLCEKNWYNTFDIPISIDVDDGGSTVSGIRRITTTLNDVTVSEATSDESNELTSSASYSFNIQDIKDSDGVAAAKQGENIVTVTLTDNAGNSVTETYYIYVDVTAPVVESFNFVGKNGGEDADGRCNTVSVTDYGYYFSDDTTVTVNVADALPSSGVANIHFVAVPVDSSLSNILYESDEAATYCALAIEGTEKNSSSASFVVKAGFKGQIYAYVTDNVGNDSVENAEDISSWARPDGVILETQQQHDSREQHTSIMLGSENYVRDLANKTPLYNGNVTVSVAVSDEYAGIRDIELTVTAPYDTANNAQYPVSFNNKGSYANKNDKFIYSVGDEVSGWNISATDLNLVTKVNRVITVTNNSNDIVIYIKMTDNSGNITEQKVELNIDKDAPIINVSFAPASESDDEVYTGYFNQDRIMTVTVIERNFDPSLVTLTATKNGEIYAIGTIFGSAVQYDADAQRGIESYEYTLTHTFHEDGDYTFAISAIDLADNSTEDEAVNYGSEADRTVAKVFTVDETAPEIFIDISGEKGRDEYYKGNVTLTVAINEHNFAQTEGPFERHSITIAVMDSQSGNVVTATLPSADYSEAGDIRTFVYEFSDEFRYQVTGIIVTDMAGNQTDAYSGSYNGGDFVVDQTAPEISFFKQDMTTPLNKTASHEEDFAPVVRFLDTNLAAGDSSTYSISLTGNYNKEGLAGTSNYVYSAIPNADNPGELIIRFSSLPVEEDIDDIYTLSVTVVDKAGYETTGSAMFSVNRFGSTFMVSPETKQLIDKFYTNTEQDVKIIQINSAEVTDQSITLTRNNNINNDLVEGRDYTIKADIPDSNNMTDSSWYEYDYTINAANFVQEGIYSATVYSSDSADNTITSVTSKRTINLFKDIERADKALLTSDSGLEANVNFRMDKTKPFAFASDLDKSQYFSGSHAFTIHATDDVKLASVTLTIDGVEKAVYDASEIENGKEYVLTNDTNEMQEIVISAVDMAGNVYMPSEDEILHVQVTRNLFKWYQNNTIAQIISIVILVAVVILLIILIKRRKNKSEEA